MANNEDYLILEKGVDRHFSKGSILFSQGDPSDALFIIKSGEVEVFLLTEDGKKLSLNVLGEKEIFGEIGVLDSGHRTAFAAAKTDTVVKRLPKEEVIKEIRRNSDFSLMLIDLLCSRIRWINNQVEDLALLSTPSRIANRMLLLHDKFSAEAGTINMSQYELSEFMGTSRETINKTLQTWYAQDIVRVSRGSIKILDREKLTLIARN